MDAESFLMGDGHWDWWQSVRNKFDKSAQLRERMEDFYSAILKELPAEGLASPAKPVSVSDY